MFTIEIAYSCICLIDMVIIHSILSQTVMNHESVNLCGAQYKKIEVEVGGTKKALQGRLL